MKHDLSILHNYAFNKGIKFTCPPLPMMVEKFGANPMWKLCDLIVVYIFWLDLFTC